MVLLAALDITQFWRGVRNDGLFFPGTGCHDWERQRPAVSSQGSSGDGFRQSRRCAMLEEPDAVHRLASPMPLQHAMGAD